MENTRSLETANRSKKTTRGRFLSRSAKSFPSFYRVPLVLFIFLLYGRGERSCKNSFSLTFLRVNIRSTNFTAIDRINRSLTSVIKGKVASLASSRRADSRRSGAFLRIVQRWKKASNDSLYRLPCDRGKNSIFRREFNLSRNLRLDLRNEREGSDEEKLAGCL